MNAMSSSMSELASRIGDGDERARMEMHATLGPHLERIVRRTLERGECSSSVSRKITAAARRLGVEDFQPNEQASLVAENLRHAIVNQFGGGTEEFQSPFTRVV